MRRPALSSLLFFVTSMSAAQDLVRRHGLPDRAVSPDVVVNEKVVDLVYGSGGDAFHQRSEDGGRTFAPAVRVNDRPGSVFSAMERGPRVAVGKDGTVHVVSAPDKLLGVSYARRKAGADAFEPTRDLRYEGATAAEGTTLAAHGDTVLVVWLDGKSGEPKNSPTGLPLFARISRDGGEKFEAAAPLAHDYDGGACACCHLSAAVDGDGRFVVAFRGARDSVRDIFLLRGDKDARRFKTARVTQDDWSFRGCPMDGPRLGQGKDALMVAHTIDGRVGWNRIDGSKVQGCQRAGEPKGKFPLALQRPDGATLIAWVEGEDLKWIVRDSRGKSLGSGDLPGPRSRPAGLVDPEGQFVLVY